MSMLQRVLDKLKLPSQPEPVSPFTVVDGQLVDQRMMDDPVNVLVLKYMWHQSYYKLTKIWVRE